MFDPSLVRLWIDSFGFVLLRTSFWPPSRRFSPSRVAFLLVVAYCPPFQRHAEEGQDLRCFRRLLVLVLMAVWPFFEDYRAGVQWAGEEARGANSLALEADLADAAHNDEDWPVSPAQFDVNASEVRKMA